MNGFYEKMMMMMRGDGLDEEVVLLNKYEIEERV